VGVVLERVDLGDGGDFCFVEVFCGRGEGEGLVLDVGFMRWLLMGEEGRERTTCAVADFVVACKVAQVDVLEPGHPGVILLVVLVFGPLHFVCEYDAACGLRLVVMGMAEMFIPVSSMLSFTIGKYVGYRVMLGPVKDGLSDFYSRAQL
jgi:hypothetical protein